MKNRTKRLVSVLCVLALLIGIVPVQMASAAQTTMTLDISTLAVQAIASGTTITGGTGNKFTIGGNTKTESNTKEFSDGYKGTVRYSFGGATKNDSGWPNRTIAFTTTEKATVTVWWNIASAGRYPTIWNSSKTKIHDMGDSSTATGNHITSYDLTSAGTYYVGASNGLYLFKVEVVEGEADPKYAVSFATMTNGTATADVTETEAGNTVTITPAPAAGYVVDAVTTTPAATVTKQADGTYTFPMPGEATTVTVTFKAGSAEEVVGTVKTAVTNALAEWAVDAKIAQATWAPADAAAAKTEIEKVIGLKDGAISGVTASVEISSGFAAAVAGADEAPLGTNGSVPYTITLTKDTVTETVTGTVTITATAHTVDKSTLTAALAAAKVAQGNVVTSTDGSDVYASVKWIKSDDAAKTALDSAITSGDTLFASDSAKASEVAAAASDLEAKTTAFVAAAKAGTKPTPTSGTSATTYTLGHSDFNANKDTTGSSNKVIKGLGTAGVFSIHMGSSLTKIGDGTVGSKTFQGAPSGAANPSSSDVRLNLGGKAAVTDGIPSDVVGFVTSGPATVNIWWVEAGDDHREMIVLDDTGASAGKSTAGASTAKNAGAYSSMRLSKAGTYYLGGDPNKNYIFKIDVIVDAAAAGPTGVTVSGPAGLDEGTGTSVTLGAADVTAQMTATVTAASGTPDQSVSWKVEPTGKGVTISDTGLVTVAPTAEPGEYTVTATSTVDTTVSGTRKLTVKGLVIDSVTIKDVTGKAKTVAYGEALTLAAEVATSGGVIAGAEDKAVTWASDTTDVAEINATTGVVTLKKAGTAKITATSVKDSTKKDEITLTVEEADVVLGIKTRNLTIDSAGRDVVFKVGKPGTEANSVAALPKEILDAVTIKVTLDSDTADKSTELNLTQTEIQDEDQTRPMPWNYKMTLPANTTGADQVYTVTVSFPGIADKYNAAADVTATFTVGKPGTKTIYHHSQTGHGAQLELTSGDSMTLSLDAVVKMDGEDQLSDEIVFTWKKDGTVFTTGVVNGKVTEEGEHKDHWLSTYTVSAVTTADAGVYTCEMTAEGAEEHQPATITVKVSKKAATTTPSAAFEAATYTLSGVQSGWKYSLDGGENWIDITAASLVTDEAKTLREHGIQVMIPGGTEMEDAIQTIALTRAATPTLTAGDATITIVGYTAGTAYQIKSDGAWADATVNAQGKITGLTNGTTYTIRVKGAGTVLPSETAQARPVAGAGDMTALLAAIETAKGAKTNVMVATKAEDVLASRKWVTQAVMDTFNTAIATAETASGQTGSTQSVIDAAKTALEQAIATFNAAKKDGTKVIEPADKTALEAAISAAEDKLGEVTESADGAGLDNGTKWALKADMDAYQAAIDAALEVLNDEEASSNQVKKAVDDLATATTAFDAKIHTVGGVTPPTPTVDKTALNEAITAAKAIDASGVKLSETEGADVPTTDKWIAKSVKDTFDAKLAAAEAVAAKADATQDEVDTAKTELADAAAALTAAIENAANGTKPVDKADLTAAIAEAKKAKEGITVNAGPADQVPEGTKFVSQAVMDALDAAITKAQAAADKEDATTETLTAAITELKAAVKTFTDAVETGTYVAPSRPNRPTTSGGSNNSTTQVGTTTTTNPDGSVVTTKKDKDGNVEITVKDGDREVIAEIKLPATVATPTTKFVDVPEDHWAEKSINDMAGMGVVKGVNDEGTIFDMTSSITRGSVAAILYRLSNGAEGKSVRFTDVAENSWYADAIGWAAAAKLVNGYADGTFGPDNTITRQELAVMIARMARMAGIDTTAHPSALEAFVDGADVGDWAAEGMAWCVKAGIVKGRGGDVLDPNATVTRAEAVTMLDRMLGLLK